jgi:hypothetical protein
MTAPLTRLAAAISGLAMLFLLTGTLEAPDSAQADVSRVYVESATIAPGETVGIDVVAEATSPGIGAWNIDLTYDNDLIGLNFVETNFLCSPSFSDDTGRMVGSSATGLVGTTVLCTFTFEAGPELGEAVLELTINQFTDPTGANIAVVAEDGAITIVDPTPTPAPTAEPTPSPTPLATPLPTPAVPHGIALPSSGGAQEGSGSGVPSVHLAAVAAGTVLLAAGAWVLRWRG